MCVRKISAQCVLQFTPSLAAGCVLHRPVSRVIHCSELFFWGFFRARGSLPPLFAFEMLFREVTSPVEGRSFRGEHDDLGPAAQSRTAETSKLGSETVGVLRRWRCGGPPLFEPGTRASTPCAEVAAGNRHLTDSLKCVRIRGWRPTRGCLPGFFCVSFVSLRRRRPDDGNDPTTGSPTVTLLRLLLPLNDQVRSSFRHAAATRRPLRAPVRRPH